MSSANMKDLLKVLKANARIGKATLLISHPGMGKSALVESLATEMADEHGPLPFYAITGSQHDPADFTGYPVVEDANSDGNNEVTSGRYMSFLPIKFAHELQKHGRGILFLDELSTAAESQQAAMLRLLQERTVGDVTLPNSVVLIAAANPTTSGTNAWNFSAPFANRICHVHWNPSTEDWEQGMLSNWGKHMDEYDSRWLVKIVSYIRAYPDHLHSLMSAESNPQGSDFRRDETTLSGAWPSHRTWHNVALALAALDRDNELNDNVTSILLNGWVGKSCATQFEAWLASYDLPDVFDVLDNPDHPGVNWDETDQAYVMMGAAISAVGRVRPSDLPENPTEEDRAKAAKLTTEKVVNLLRHVAGLNYVDIAAAMIPEFIKNIRKHHEKDAEDRKAWLKETMVYFGDSLKEMSM